MKDEKIYGPGEYSVEVTLRTNTRVLLGEEATEDQLLNDCKVFGEVVDWEVSE